MKLIEKRLSRWKNELRAQGVLLASELLRRSGESMDPEETDLRRGMLLAAGFCSVLSTTLRTGEPEMGFIDVDGDRIPVDLRLTVEG